MRHRKLRIAFSAMCGMACVLLLALWARSYWWEDELRVPYSVSRVEYFFINSGDGLIYSVLHFYGSGEPGFGINSNAINEEALFVDDATPLHSWHLFRIVRWQKYTVVYVPHWFFTLLFAIAASAPWVHWSRRFSLRTLLIATTLVAVVLGIVVAFRC